MDTITQNETKFDSLFTNCSQQNNEDFLKEFSYLLEKYDDYLFSKRKDLIICKKVQRKILTSRGPVSFKRRYYLDSNSGKHLYLLDSILKIPKYTRVSEELKKKIILSLDHLTLEQAGKDNLPEGYSLSAVSVYNLLKKASIRSFYHSFPTTSSAIHVQLDEKYIHMRNARKKAGKQRLYTATIFSGIIHNKKRNMLKNRMIISSRNLTTLFNKINYFLKYIYNVSLDSHIFISGDLAIYIQISPDRITVCKATYVPDKFHVAKIIKSLFHIPLVKADILSGTFVPHILDLLSNLPKDKWSTDAYTLAHLLHSHPNSLLLWYDPHYFGCSQEGMNSHYYAFRFDAKPNIFRYNTIDKICEIINSRYNNSSLEISFSHKLYSIPNHFNFENTFSVDFIFDNPSTPLINYNSFSPSSRRIFNSLSGLIE